MKDDTVSRASVLKAIDEYERLSMVSQTVRNMTSLREIVQWLPAVQTCEDAVSRQAAIDALSTPHGILYPIRTVEELPSVQPETAKRIVCKSRDGMTLWYQCDMCNEPVDAQDNFCRGCGRRLTDG